jgi:hypothetical protein
MCGIVGLFLKDPSLEPKLGQMLTDMLITMTDRGPDSAGIAIYGAPMTGDSQADRPVCQIPDEDFEALEDELGGHRRHRQDHPQGHPCRSGNACSAIDRGAGRELKTLAPRAAHHERRRPDRDLQGGGPAEGRGSPLRLADNVRHARHRPHAHGNRICRHDRARTRSRPGPTSASCTTARCPTTTRCAASWRDEGHRIETENDTEVGAAYLTWKMQRRARPWAKRWNGALDDLDGFFTFVVGTRDGFGVVRDPIACKPAVMAETDQYVAFGSNTARWSTCPASRTARVWEPEPATVYFWTH